MDSLFASLKSELANSSNSHDSKQIYSAFKFAKKAHSGQKRLSGEDFIVHPVEVAKLVCNIGLDDKSVIAALLHDTLEDTKVTKEDISKEFGTEVLSLVEGVTNLRGLKKVNGNEGIVANTRKMILASTNDVRILLIKLCDRLHNARTISGLSEERQKTYAEEILLIFAPLSEYFGIASFQKEFQDIAFQKLDPKEYQKITKSISELSKQQSSKHEEFLDEIERILKEIRIKGKTEFRTKGTYSIYRKLENKKKDNPVFTVSDLYDIFAARVLVKNIPQCYLVLGALHQRWNYLPEEFEDYISNPKPNGYRSIHTILETKRWGKIEVQIKTYEMHEYNELGPASHIAYKLGKNNKSNAFGWVKNLVKWSNTKKDSSDKFKVQLFRENVYLFSPKGELIELPRGATPIDFAYRIHSNIGNSCTGAKVNGKIVPLDTKLKTGDQVEIIVSSSKKYPSRDWLDIVASQSTKSHIRKSLREKDSLEARENGKMRLFTAIRDSKNYSDNEIESMLEKYLYKLQCKNLEDLYEMVGHRIISSQKVINTIYPQPNLHTETKKSSKPIGIMQIQIEGMDGINYVIAKCCNPKPFDNICAYITTGNETKIHKTGCKTFERQTVNKLRLLNAAWSRVGN